MNKRIIELRKYLHLSQTEFANKIGMKQTSLSNIENNNCIVTERTILAICSQFNVNEEWLRFGTGSMFKTVNKLYNELFEIYNNLSKPLQDFLIRIANDLLDTQSKL